LQPAVPGATCAQGPGLRELALADMRVATYPVWCACALQHVPNGRSTRHPNPFVWVGQVKFAVRRVVPEEEYAAWAVRFEAARGALADRALALDAAAEAVERDLLLLGATAIEDKLQQARRGPPRPH